MTGFRGTPCFRLHSDFHYETGKQIDYCKRSTGNVYEPTQDNLCIPGRWCTLVGDSKFHIVKELPKNNPT